MGSSTRCRAFTAAVLLAAALLTACESAEGTVPTTAAPVVVEDIDGSAIQRLTLSDSAAERLDIQTAVVAVSGSRLVVPRRAVIIDATGAYWVYTNPEPFVFIRHQIRDVHEEGHHAFFNEGPEAGMAVVTTGVPELYGAEFGIGK
jgi:hypothetical protein